MYKDGIRHPFTSELHLPTLRSAAAILHRRVRSWPLSFTFLTVEKENSLVCCAFDGCYYVFALYCSFPWSRLRPPPGPRSPAPPATESDEVLEHLGQIPI